MRKIFLLSSFLLITSHFFAQTQTMVLGSIQNPEDSIIRISYYSNLLDMEEIVYETPIDSKGQFASILPLEKAGELSLTFNEQTLYIFAEPGERIEVNFDSKTLQSSAIFIEETPSVNSFFHAFNKEFRFTDLGSASMSPNIFVNYEVYENLLTLAPLNFMEYVQKSKQAELDFFQKNLSNYSLSTAFINYIEAFIQYRWATYPLVYPLVSKQVKSKEDLPADYYNFIQTVPYYQTVYLNSNAYLNYLDRFLIYQAYQNGATEENLFRSTYIEAETWLDGDVLALVQGRILYRTLYPKSKADYEPVYQDYVNRLGENPFTKIIKERYALLKSVTEGGVDPKFMLKDMDGNEVRFGDFAGKYVYISFWASWCKPCIEEIEEARANILKLKDSEDIVFLYITIDTRREPWKAMIEKKAVPGIQLWGEGPISPVTDIFSITTLPRYFLLDREGEFVEFFEKASADTFLKYVRGLP